ncbi:response regulator [Phycicoccus jejuensis]|uniref:response regulator n=1 Tax=Phycicoccus jejuensis TaxID=367299 RepID=UPI00384E0D74
MQADNGAAGVEAARRHDREVVLLDISLPQMDGLEVCRRSRAMRRRPRVHVAETDLRRFGPLTLDPEAREVRLHGEVVDLTRTEYFSALESGELEMESTSTDVRALIQDVCTMFTTKAERRGLSLWWSVDPDVPELVCSDLVRLRQVLVNLVGNGLKFTERGGVRIHASHLAAAPLLRPDAETAPGTLVLEVVDTGMGIPADRLSRIFTAFAQGDASTTRTHGGTGLGLAICARIAQRLGGAIQVQSTVGEGSSFTFSLPVLGCAGGSAGATGIEALQALSAHRYDVVLMDVNMPNLDGVRATEQLRVRPGPPPRIIALTANAAEGDRERMLAAGMDDYLSKPYTLADLEKILAPVRAG